MSFTWLIVFVVIGLTGAWWWQNHKAQQEEIATMADQSSAQLSQNNEGQSVPLTDGNADAGTNVPLTDNSAAPADAAALRHRRLPLRCRARLSSSLPWCRQARLPCRKPPRRHKRRCRPPMRAWLRPQPIRMRW